MTTLNTFGTQPLGFAGGASPSAPLAIDAVAETVISQYASSPIITTIIGSLNDAIDRLADIDAFFRSVWNIETATGYGLDLWGRIVGVTRNLFIADGDYFGFADSERLPFGSGVFWGGSSTTPNYRLTDIAYRRLILAKAALNITNGSIPAINAILRALFPEYGNVYVRDNGDMTITYVFGAALSKVDYAIVSQSGALPKPVGVSFDVEQP